jgi:hypothetical protein
MYLEKEYENRTIRLVRLHWFGHVQRFEENRIPKRVLSMNLETRPSGRPRNKWQEELREDVRMVKSGRKKYITGRNGSSY